MLFPILTLYTLSGPCTDPDTDETREVGEEFQADPCTTCRCTESGAQCDMIMCDIPDCEGIGEGWRLFTRPDQCCPGCKTCAIFL